MIINMSQTRIEITVCGSTCSIYIYHRTITLAFHCATVLLVPPSVWPLLNHRSGIYVHLEKWSLVVADV